MAIEYNKTNWVNNETKLNATNMNHIEDGIKNASDELNTKASVDYVNKTHYGYSGDDLLIIPEGTTTIANNAYQNANYKCVVIPDSVTSIGNRAFSACGSLTSVTIPNSVMSIGNYAFSACGSLTNITIPNGVTSIGNSAFYNCSSLTGVTIGNDVTNIGEYVFYGCSSLTSVTIPNSVTSIGYSTFHDCPLITIDLTAYTTQSFPTIDKYNFNAIASDCQIKVVKGRKNDLIATSGWSDYASYVVEVPTVETLETALEQDYWKIQKTPLNTAPMWDANRGTQSYAAVVSEAIPGTLAYRDSNGSAAFHRVKVGNGTIEDISDDKGTSSTIAVSQKCLNDNYLPLTGGTISGVLTVDSNNNHGVYISNSGIIFNPGPFDAVSLTKESCQSLVNHAYIHQYKLIKGSNVLIIQDVSSSNQLANNPVGMHVTDGQIGYFYNGTTTELVLIKILYGSGRPTGIQCLNFAEQVVTTFEYDQSTFTDIIIK